jgi:hypothetical protein
MKTQSIQSKAFRWIFFLISVGMLIAGGIYIEKIVLTDATAMDILTALAFCLVGAGISAYSCFGIHQES